MLYDINNFFQPIKYCIKGYFRPVWFSPFYTCNSPLTTRCENKTGGEFSPVYSSTKKNYVIFHITDFFYQKCSNIINWFFLYQKCSNICYTLQTAYPSMWYRISCHYISSFMKYSLAIYSAVSLQRFKKESTEQKLRLLSGPLGNQTIWSIMNSIHQTSIHSTTFIHNLPTACNNICCK